jgi:peptidoglycan/xylan/chitin deacetylase (PgdA/CDA1 family)
MMGMVDRVRRVAKRLGRRHARKALILLYHRVATPRSDPWALSVAPARFAEHLEVLREYASPIPLSRLVRDLREGSVSDRSVAVTFDDGYVDNLHVAKPLLIRHNVPATVFVPSGTIGSEQEYWWDELDRLLLQPGILPEELCLSVDGEQYRWELGETARYGEEEVRRYRSWRAWKDAPTARHSLYSSLWELMHPMAEPERQEVLAKLRQWSGVEPAVRSEYRTLSPGELVALSQGGLVEIGAHTVTHPSLSALPVASQRYEIQGSKARLEETLGRSVTSFAYPYGQRSDYSAETIEIVRQAGFVCSCSNFAGHIEVATDLFQLPRLFTLNWDGDRFANQLRQWLDG